MLLFTFKNKMYVLYITLYVYVCLHECFYFIQQDVAMKESLCFQVFQIRQLQPLCSRWFQVSCFCSGIMKFILLLSSNVLMCLFIWQCLKVEYSKQLLMYTDRNLLCVFLAFVGLPASVVFIDENEIKTNIIFYFVNENTNKN